MRKTRTRDVGLEGENLACTHLQKMGFKLKQRNYLCRLGEIDLIMQDGDVRVFVEVRLRSMTLYGYGYETVSYRKQQKIIRTTKLYQQKENYWGDIRFDVVSIEWNKDRERQIIQHIPDAFSADV